MWTTVVGNYPKIPNLPAPGRLRSAITSFDNGKITQEELANVADDVTIEVIQEQIEAGVDIVTDGHIRWQDAQTPLARGLDGFSISGLIRYFDTNTYYRQPVVEGPVRWKEPILVRDLKFAIENSTKPVKAVLTGPFTLARLSVDRHYSNGTSLVKDLARALNEEARALEEAGAAMVQFDEPALVRDKDSVSVFSEAAPILLEGLKGKKALYTYFGDVDGILPALLESGFDVLGLDFTTNDRNWSLIEKSAFPIGLAAGIVDGRNTLLETSEDVARDTKRLLERVPADRLYLNPSFGLEFLPREQAREKLSTLCRGVRMVNQNAQ
ncbi:MAG: methylcobamide--CoM methyltransferase [Planctomycetota bacterium]|nr:methylcobamide--CoM methyltransferase [Planctomycetota bacterium]